MNIPQPIKVAAVGLGWVALNRHLPTLDKSPHFEVIGVIDRAADRASVVSRQRRYDHHWCGARLAEAPWIDEVDAVTISTAPFSHYELASEALRLGKHVLTEKPFTMSVSEAHSLVALAEKSDRRLAVVHNFQFSRSARRLDLDVVAGRLGNVVAANAVQFGNPRRRLPSWCDELPLGLFYDESPHLLYLLRKYMGKIDLLDSVVINGSSGRTPARLDAYFESANSTGPVTLSCSFEMPISEWYFMLVGSEAVGIVDVFRDAYVRIPNDGAHEAKHIMRTSLVASGSHWSEFIKSGFRHVTGTLSYGNEEVFERFAHGVRGDAVALEPISGTRALEILCLQHDIVSRSRAIAPRKT